jgi:hypothetical protein
MQDESLSQQVDRAARDIEVYELMFGVRLRRSRSSLGTVGCQRADGRVAFAAIMQLRTVDTTRLTNKVTR